MNVALLISPNGDVNSMATGGGWGGDRVNEGMIPFLMIKHLTVIKNKFNWQQKVM